MKNSKLIYLLSSLNKSEFRKFGQFLKKTFFKKDKSVIKLYEVLDRRYPDFKESLLEKERIAKIIFGKNTMAEQKKLTYTMSYFTKALNDYILWEQIQKQTYERDFLYLEAYKERGLDKFFYKKAEEIQEKLDRQPRRDAEYYQLCYQLNTKIFDYKGMLSFKDKADSFKEMIERFDLYLLSTKLTQYFVALNINAFVEESEKIPIAFDNEILAIAKQDPYNKKSLLKIYYLLVEQLQDDSRMNYENYFELKELVLEHIHIFGKEDLGEIFINLLNYTIKMYGQGEDSFFRERFEICKYAIENKIFFFNEKIPYIIFYNTIQAGCELGEFEWVDIFFNKYKNDIEDKAKEKIELLSLAYINMCQKNYGKALDFLKKIKYSSYYDHLLAKPLRIRIYFEQDEDVLLYDLLELFAHYIRRHPKIVDFSKEQMNNFIRFTKIIYQNKYSYKYSKQELIELLSEHKNTGHKIWLRRMIEEGKY